MAKNKYPCPCNSCENSGCRNGGGYYSKLCQKYQDWIAYWWRRFKRDFYVPARKPQRTSFAYAHPTEIEDYLKHSPCDNCKAANCDIPCPEYLRWYNARLQVARKKVGL